MKLSLSILSLALLAGCSKEPQAADNTGRNARDKDGETVTPMDQSNKDADIAVTQAIRKSLVDDDTLSVSAENIKVITENGKVTLRGVVASAEEKERILSKAKSLAGTLVVDDQLEVKK